MAAKSYQKSAVSLVHRERAPDLVDGGDLLDVLAHGAMPAHCRRRGSVGVSRVSRRLVSLGSATAVRRVAALDVAAQQHHVVLICAAGQEFKKISYGGLVRQHMMVYDSRNTGMDKQSEAAGWFMTQEKTRVTF